MDAVKQLCFDWSRGRFPENLSGAYYEPMDATVPQQFFATSMLVTPLIRGMLGWSPDAPEHRASLTPQMPPSWDTVRVRRLHVGSTRIDAELVRAEGHAGARLTSHGPAVDVDVSLPVPLGALGVMAGTGHTSAGAADEPGNAAPEVAWGPHDGHLTQRLHLAEGDTVTADVYWRGGLSVEPPTVHLVPGQESTGLRVVDFTAENGGWLLELEGQAGRTYTLDLYGERPTVADASGVTAELEGAGGPSEASAARAVSGSPASSVNGRHPLRLRFPDGEGRLEARVRLRATPGR